MTKGKCSVIREIQKESKFPAEILTGFGMLTE